MARAAGLPIVESSKSFEDGLAEERYGQFRDSVDMAAGRSVANSLKSAWTEK